LLKQAAEEYRAATLLAAEEGAMLDDFAEWDALLEEERWEDVVAPYQAAAQQQVAEAQQRRRKDFRERRSGSQNTPE
jgi:4-alpha-glucanotransferase